MSESALVETPEQAEFRQYCRSWIAANHPGESPVRLPQSAIEIMNPDQMDFLQAWQKSAYDAGLVGCDYPKECGGGGHTNFQRIANDELVKAKTPILPNVIGLGMAAPTILNHASDELKAQLLPKLLSGEEIWCQGFSEPGAGSDLANVQTFAEPTDDGKWVINGHKVWTSLAHFADWMIILVRTDKSHKYDGLSYFVVPIKAALGKGVTVRPLIKMTGETGFNEVLFENLVIEDRMRLDELGKGWQVAMTTLLFERGAGNLDTPRAGGMESKTSFTSSVGSVMKLATETMRNGKPASEDPVLRDTLMQELVKEEGFMQTQRRARVRGLIDHPMRIPLQGKLLVSELHQRTANLAMEVAGAKGTLYLADSAAPTGGQWPLAYMNSFGFTIAAGTSEVQRNILGERVLGLPKSK
jgi:alkylation response protein AidB-like acyl-CoA dehydrogenase